MNKKYTFLKPITKSNNDFIQLDFILGQLWSDLLGNYFYLRNNNLAAYNNSYYTLDQKSNERKGGREMGKNTKELRLI